jgi:hypothetical protein
MKNDIENSMKCSYYETYIHRANRKYDTLKPGGHGSIIENFIRVENGDNSFVKWHGTYEKQLGKIKFYMHRAMDKYLKIKKIPKGNREKLEFLKYQINNAYSSDDLMKIIRETIELTQCIKDY